MLAEITAILAYTAVRPSPATASPAGTLTAGGNTKVVGMLLYTDYLIPFEVASVLLLVAMIGAILLAKKELD